jgi:Na+-translocating ferredoxin:NAD+ oxidoreductase RnfD subunit
MSADTLSECMNDGALIVGIVCGILLVLIFAIVWGYHRDA